MFKGYASDKFYDEMFSPDGTVRPHCEPLYGKFEEIETDDFLSRKATSELYFMRQGITFNVYHDDQGSERIFPFDPVPRVIPAARGNPFACCSPPAATTAPISSTATSPGKWESRSSRDAISS